MVEWYHKREVKKGKVAQEAVMVVIAQMAKHRQRVRKAGLASCKCVCVLEHDVCNFCEMVFIDREPVKHQCHLHYHCKYCAKMFKTPDHVFKHYCLKHKDKFEGLHAELIL